MTVIQFLNFFNEEVMNIDKFCQSVVRRFSHSMYTELFKLQIWETLHVQVSVVFFVNVFCFVLLG